MFRRINRFERAVGARLFERLPDGYQLSIAGEELLEHAQRIGQEVDALQLKISGKDYRPSGTVRLTAPDNLAYVFLPQYLRSFSSSYPDISFELLVGAATLDLTRREADLAIRATTDPPPHLVGRRVLGLKWAFYASPSYISEFGQPNTQAALSKHRLLAADGELARLPAFRRLASTFADAIVMTCSTLNAMSAMAEAGHGIALLPDDQMKPTLVRIFEVEPEFISEIWLLTHPELRRTERIRLLLEHLYESFRGDPRLQDVAIH